MKSPVELRAQRMVTRQFIKADVVEIALHTRVLDAGGVLQDGPDRPLQKFRLIPQIISPNSGARYDETQASTATFIFVLMGYWDVQMELYDWWENPETGQLLEINTMLPDNGYERKGLVDEYDRSK